MLEILVGLLRFIHRVSIDEHLDATERCHIHDLLQRDAAAVEARRLKSRPRP